MIKSWPIYFFLVGGVHVGTLETYRVYNWIINNTNQTKSPCWAQKEKNKVLSARDLWSSQLPGWRQSGWAGQVSRDKALNRYPPKQWSMAHPGKVCWNMLLLCEQLSWVTTCQNTTISWLWCFRVCFWRAQAHTKSSLMIHIWTSDKLHSLSIGNIGYTVSPFDWTRAGIRKQKLHM